jgi:GMP synthase-like glutamine amidotransferase
MRIAVVEHQPDAPAGLFGAWAEARGHELELLRAPRLHAWPDPRDHGGVVALGSDRSVHASPDAWIAAEVGFLRAAHDAGVPVLGLCFGAQALATALGGEVRRAPSVEIGWIRLEAAAAGAGPIVPGPWFAWHEDTFTVPPAARELARSKVAPQAFALGASVGLQFHPEVDEAIVGQWVDGGRRKLVAARIDENRLRAETARRAPDARRRAFELFDAVVRRWARAGDAVPRGAGADRAAATDTPRMGNTSTRR